jgi:CheY-like chemotaxis protein
MSSNGTILVVEDQESARESLVELLRGEGYDVHEAADGQDGISKINQLDLDVVLTDLMMPGADGLTVLKHVRDFSPQTLVVLMTAHASWRPPSRRFAPALRIPAGLLVFDDVLRKIKTP